MKKTPLILACIAVLAVSCGRNDAQEKAGRFSAAYGAISQKYAAMGKALSGQMRQAASQPEFTRIREEYNRVQTAHKGELEALLREHAQTPASDELQLLRGRVLLELARFDEAETVLDALLARNSPLAAAAKVEKIKIHIIHRRLPQALALFRQVEAAAAHDIHYFSFLLVFAMESEPAEVRREFTRRFMAAADLPPEIKASRTRILASLANSAWQHDEMDQAREIMRQAVAGAADPREAEALKVGLRQIESIGQPAAAWSADNWLIGQPVSLSALRGRVVVLEFWATWCQPCREVAPALEKMYRERAGRGLTVVGMTKLYGNYVDELQKKEKVKPEEETSLIQAYLQRHPVSYPVAVDRQGKAFASYQVTALPTIVLIDRRGVVRQMAIGMNSVAALDKQVLALLEEKP